MTWFSLRYVLAAGLVVAACSGKKAAHTVPGPVGRSGTRAAAETVTVRDPETERRISRLELRVMDRDAQLADLEVRLNDAQQEVVRAMAKLQTIASRAEAASGMAEAEGALRTLRSVSQSAPEAVGVSHLLRQSSTEFDKQNYGGALYLANQAKTLAGTGRGRLSGDERAAPRSGETPFAVPVTLKAASRGNVREGPGTNFKIAFAAETGLLLTGYSYVDEWIRVSDETGRNGWIFKNLVERR